MKKLALGAMALALAVPALAMIQPKAVGASQNLADRAEELHDFMHHKYGPSYGSHGFEGVTGDARDALELWELGAATECDVVATLGAVDASFADLTSQFQAAGVMSDKQTKKEYIKTRNRYHLFAAFTAAARCAGMSATSQLASTSLEGSL
jgi:hypothetical protein